MCYCLDEYNLFHFTQMLCNVCIPTSFKLWSFDILTAGYHFLLYCYTSSAKKVRSRKKRHPSTEEASPCHYLQQPSFNLCGLHSTCSHLLVCRCVPSEQESVPVCSRSLWIYIVYERMCHRADSAPGHDGEVRQLEGLVEKVFLYLLLYHSTSSVSTVTRSTVI